MSEIVVGRITETHKEITVHALTRRRLLTTAAAAAAGTHLVPLHQAATAFAAVPALTARQRATYRGFVEAIAELPGVPVQASRSDFALSYFEQQYRAAPEHIRTGLANALDLMDNAIPGSFAALNRRERLALLHQKAAPPTQDPGREPGRVRERTAVAVLVDRATQPFLPLSAA